MCQTKAGRNCKSALENGANRVLKMAVLANRPSKTLGFLHVFPSENYFFNTLQMCSGWTPHLLPIC
jgi:hypothetical protein